jgi:hypothetical protein
MGRAGYLVTFLQAALDGDYEDDQVNFNALCSQFEWVAMDTEQRIFYNKKPGAPDSLEPPGIYFKSSPGTPSVQRYTRAVGEYYQFFIREISIVLLIVILVLFLWVR